jgi:16S rRNA (guanine527-N7)-methyltransferase
VPELHIATEARLTRTGDGIVALGADASLQTLEQLLRHTCSELGLALSELQIRQLATHFSLLLRWNQKMNLSSVRDTEGIMQKHFGESLFLAKLVPPSISSDIASPILLDVGSGAGFPGLPLKVTHPALRAVLLEPIHKKAAFLKEAIRSMGLLNAEVRVQRLDWDWHPEMRGQVSLITTRAVAISADMLDLIARMLTSDGLVALLIGQADADRLRATQGFVWNEPVPLPGSERRVVLLGKLNQVQLTD